MPKQQEQIPHTFVYRGEADHSVALVACFNKFHPSKEDTLTRSEARRHILESDQKFAARKV